MHVEAPEDIVLFSAAPACLQCTSYEDIQLLQLSDDMPVLLRRI